jgi:ribosomal protein S1
LEISSWESDLEATYQKRINTLVEFKMLKPKKNDQLFAVLSNRIFKEEYQELAQLMDAQTSIPATITGCNSHGYFVTILGNNTIAFIDCSKAKLTSFNFEKGAIINVVVKGSHENGIRVAIV